MSSKRKKSRRDGRDEYDDDKPKKSSLVDYSKVSSRPDATPRRSGESSTAASAPAPAAAAAPGSKMSSQMEAVVRLMSGAQERTIAQKLADSNRPTWEAYKKQNEDRLNLEGLDQKKMEEYRRELDSEREKRLGRGLNHGAKKKKKRKKHSSGDDDDSSSSSSDDRKHRKRKKHKKKKDRKKHHKRKRDNDPESDSDTSSNEEEKGRKKKNKKKKKSKKEGDNEDSDGDHYRLSSFFTTGTDDDE